MIKIKSQILKNSIIKNKTKNLLLLIHLHRNKPIHSKLILNLLILNLPIHKILLLKKKYKSKNLLIKSINVIKLLRTIIHKKIKYYQNKLKTLVNNNLWIQNPLKSIKFKLILKSIKLDNQMPVH
jgi:ribosomal protein L31E